MFIRHMFVYHACPARMLGHTLYPLRDLAHADPVRYAHELAKYNDHPARQRIPHQGIPKLACTRQEVLSFAAVHPHVIFRAWAELGVTLPSKLWFRIPVVELAELPAVLFTPRQNAVGDDILDSDVTWLEADNYEELTELPAATLEWYEKLHRSGKRGAWFVGVPHVWVKGALSVAGLEPLDWSVPF